MPRIKIQNEEIYYNQVGKLEAEKSLVFIPGSGMTEKLMGIFSANFNEYNTVTVDLPGHGQSTGSIKESIPQLVSCLEEAIRVLHQQKVLTEDITILGYSLGGFAAISLGLVDMPQIKRVVLISSCADLSTNPLGNALAEMTTIDPMQVYSTLCGSGTEKEKRIEIEKMFTEDLKDAAILFKDLYSCRTFNIMDKVSNIKKPVLVVIGDEDQVVQLKDAMQLAKSVEGAKFIQYSGFGHGMLFENTQQVVADIKNFIN